MISMYRMRKVHKAWKRGGEPAMKRAMGIKHPGTRYQLTWDSANERWQPVQQTGRRR